jgi:hypothetical protein
MGKKEKIPPTIKNVVWIKYMGNVYKSKCFCCIVEIITMANFECGYMIGKKNGGKTIISNLRPICSLCNESIGIQSMGEFIEKYGLHVDLNNEILPESTECLCNMIM